MASACAAFRCYLSALLPGDSLYRAPGPGEFPPEAEVVFSAPGPEAIYDVPPGASWRREEIPEPVWALGWAHGQGLRALAREAPPTPNGPVGGWRYCRLPTGEIRRVCRGAEAANYLARVGQGYDVRAARSGQR